MCAVVIAAIQDSTSKSRNLSFVGQGNSISPANLTQKVSQLLRFTIFQFHRATTVIADSSSSLLDIGAHYQKAEVNGMGMGLWWNWWWRRRKSGK